MGSVLLQSTFTSLQTAARQPRPHLIFFPRPPIPLFVVIVVVAVVVVVVVMVVVVVVVIIVVAVLVGLPGLCLARLAIVACLNAVLFRGSEIG